MVAAKQGPEKFGMLLKCGETQLEAQKPQEGQPGLNVRPVNTCFLWMIPNDMHWEWLSSFEMF